MTYKTTGGDASHHYRFFGKTNRDHKGRRIVPKGYGKFLSLVPMGYDTVLGYLAKHRRDMLDLMDVIHPVTTQRDGFWLTARMHRAGIRITKVEAPKVLRRQGIPEVNCYPLSLLCDRFGD